MKMHIFNLLFRYGGFETGIMNLTFVYLILNINLDMHVGEGDEHIYSQALVSIHT